MPISLYAASVPVFDRMLNQMIKVLDIAEVYADERKIKPEVLVGSRLAPDMLPLSFQFQSATDRTKFFVARTTGRDSPSWPDDEKTFDDLRTRVKTAQEYLATFSPADLDGLEERLVTIKVAGEDRQLPAADYLFHNVYPNFFFHVTTAYAILRHNGVSIGKRDFVGPQPTAA